MTFFQALIFSLVFFAIWSLKDCLKEAGQTRALSVLAAVVFLVLAWAIGVIRV